MLAEFDRQTQFLRTEYPSLRIVFERFIIGGNKILPNMLTRNPSWTRTEVLDWNGQSFVLTVKSHEPTQTIENADFDIEISSANGAKVTAFLPTHQTLREAYDLSAYVNDMEQILSLKQIVSKFLSPHIKTLSFGSQ